MSEWDDPAANTGEFIKPSALAGHLIIVWPIGYVPHIQTRFTRVDKPSDAVCCDVVDLDSMGDDGIMGKLYRNNNFMQAKLIASLRPKIGSKILGHVGQEPSRSGMSPAWVIISASQDHEAVARANAWLQSHPNFVPTEFLPYEPRQQQPQQQQPQMGQQVPQEYLPPPQGVGASERSLLQELREREALQRLREQQARGVERLPGNSYDPQKEREKYGF